MKGVHQAAHSDYIRNTIFKQKATVFLQVSPFILLDIFKHSAGSRCFHLQSKTGNSRIVSNLGKLLPDYTVLHPTRHYSIIRPMAGPQTSHATFWRKCSKHSRSDAETALKLRLSGIDRCRWYCTDKSEIERMNWWLSARWMVIAVNYKHEGACEGMVVSCFTTLISTERQDLLNQRFPQVVLVFCPCGPLRLNISPKKTEKIKLTW
jgi:hypothetical protein